MEHAPADQATADLLAEVPLLAGLEPVMRQRLAAACELVLLHAGEVLCRQGDAGDHLFVVRSGRLRVSRTGPTGEQPVTTLGRGAIIGEMALLTGSARTATVTALRDSELLSVDRAGFETLLDDRAFALALTQGLAERLAVTTAPETRAGRHVAIVTVAGAQPSLPVRELAKAFERAPPDSWSVAVLDAAAAGGDAGDWPARVERAEHDHDLVVLVAEAPMAADGAQPGEDWTRFALRQADRALVLTRPDAPAPHRLSRRWDVGICAEVPSTAAIPQWARGCRAHHWLRPGLASTADADRAARRVTGTSLGVVMSGGGARGLAHLGVLAALAEAGTVVDRFGGTSIGALVSALAATGRDPDEIIATCRTEIAERRPFADYTFPLRGLIRGYRGLAMLRRVFEDVHAEELPASWFGVTCDLHTGETVVHRRGPVRLVIAASISLPGIAAPRWFLGRLHVDGGLSNNLPVDVMLADGEGPVIAVDVTRQWSSQVPGAPRSGQRRPVPSIVETLTVASSLSSRQGAVATRRLASLAVNPDLHDVGLLEWRRIDAIVAEGRRAAEEALAGTAGDLRETLVAGSVRASARAGRAAGSPTAESRAREAG